MGAISSVNVLQNGIGVGQAMALASILKEHPTLKSLCGNKGNEVELDMSNKRFGVAGAIMLAPEIIDNGALSVLSLKANRLLTAEAGQILSDMLATNSVLKELDVSDNNWDDGRKFLGDGPGFAKALSVGIKNNGAMSSFTFGDKEAVTMTTAMTEANFRGKLYSYEAQMVAAFLPKCT
jgi:hypothetical protein